jgi:sugar-phosphatase
VDRFGCDAVLFDLDGVLVDSTPSVERAWREWAALHGFDVADILAVAHGRRTAETISLVAPHLDAEAEAKRLETKEIEDAANVHPIEGAAALLETLPSGRWAVVTSGTRALAHARLRACGLPIPQTFVGAEVVQRGKPDLECYLRGQNSYSVRQWYWTSH